MRAITVWPSVANSARLDDIPEPPLSDGAVLVRTMALGVCGTDREIISGSYGYAPPGQQRLALGHESLGIERTGQRAQVWTPKTLLVTGAGPVGLLAGLMGVQRGLDVHVLDHNEEGPKPALARELGATYHSDGGDMARLQPDIVMECTGAPSVIRDCLGVTAPAGILCLAGVTAPGNKFDLDIGSLNRIMVRDNDVVFGTVNANRWHYKMAADALARADKAWLGRLITRRVPLDRWSEALEYRHGDIKVVIDFVQ
jgi:threonine dehydrogenase-like Zn-dependent dehydrogenase